MNASRPAAVLWDMDGTIVDTEPMWVSAEQRLLEAWGLQLHPQDIEAWVGIGLSDLATEFQHRGVRLPAEAIVNHLTRDVREQFLQQEVVWRPGAVDLLRSLAAHGIPNALVTMSQRVQALDLTALLPGGTFSTVVAGDDGTRPKPYPDPYLRAAELLGVAITECTVIEDSVTGLMAGYAAGAVTIGVPNLVDLTNAPHHRLLPSLAGCSATDIAEVYASCRAAAAPERVERS